jgi:hypothetical protein
MDRARRIALVALITASALALGTGSASAVIVRLKDGRALSYQPLRRAALKALMPLDTFFSNVEYDGGPVMASNTNYAFYWDPVSAGAPAYPAEYQSGVDQYFEDLAHDSGGHENTDSVAAQYNDAAGEFANYESRFGGAILDEDSYPPNGCKQASICLTDAQLRSELLSYIQSHDLPTGLAHEYFILTPPGVEDCFEASGSECSAGAGHAAYCAYHSYAAVAEGEIVYADDPYVTGNEGCDDGNHPNGKPSDGVLQGGLSHEHNESITDPEPNSGWIDLPGGGDEIADKCRDFEEGTEFGTPLGTAPNGASYNQVINGHLYWYQQEWSNQGERCMQRFSFSGEEPTATFTSKPGAGKQISFDAGGSSASGGVVRYDWQFNDKPGPGQPTETTTPTVTHAFPANGTYLVALTVYAGDGTSIGTASAITVGAPSAPTVKSLAPKSGPAAGGTSVKITGANLAAATAVTFGSSPAAGFTVTSASSITALSPAESSGTVNVTVTAPGGTSAISTGDRFKYATSTPTVTSVSPDSGPKSEGTIVVITGTGFAEGAGTSFKFGTRAAPIVNCSSSTSCMTIAPMATKAGKVDVTAIVGKAHSKKNPPDDRFTYF